MAARWCVVDKRSGKVNRCFGGGAEGKRKARKFCAQLNRLRRGRYTIKHKR